jgi:hypothetical protein
MSLYISKFESKLDKALSKETRESLTEWIGFKRKKTLNKKNNERDNRYSRNCLLYNYIFSISILVF